MRVADQIVKILEANGVEYVFGLPGEETISLMDALHGSKITFVMARHEQGAGFMADVYSRISQKLSVCLATLGPGATNLMTPAADAFLDYAPVLFLTGQASRSRLHKNSHQVIDTKAIFDPVSKWSEFVLTACTIPEVLQQGIKVAKTHPMGSVHLVLPEDVQALDAPSCDVVRVQFPKPTYPNEEQLKRAQEHLAKAKRPVIIAGNGVFREQAHGALQVFAGGLNIPVVETYMGKGAIENRHPMFVGVLGLPSVDAAYVAVQNADLVVTVGYDIVELEPKVWNPNMNKRIIHIGVRPAEVDRYYQLEVGLQGMIARTLEWLSAHVKPFDIQPETVQLKTKAREDINRALNEKRFPLSPAYVIHCVSELLSEDDIVVSDVGAHKVWVGRLFPCQKPGRCVISNGLATMGIALPGAIGAALADPSARVVTINGDGGFMMNIQELETAVRLKLPIVNIVFNDRLFGLIKWKQQMKHLATHYVDFENPDFVKLAESFGAKGFRVSSVDELEPVLKEALSCGAVAVVDCPVDYEENVRLLETQNTIG